MEKHAELRNATDAEGTAPMTSATDNTGRNPDGRFAKGNSGNTGRPRGSRNRATLAAEALLDGEVEALRVHCRTRSSSVAGKASRLSSCAPVSTRRLGIVECPS
jgi:hypothetical protein